MTGKMKTAVIAAAAIGITITNAFAGDVDVVKGHCQIKITRM